MRSCLFLFILVASILYTTDSFAGGPWVGDPGTGSIIFGYSRKTATNSWGNVWDVSTPGTTTVNGLVHDFRYAYLNPTWVLLPHLEFSGNFNYLWGYEATNKDVVTNKTLATPYYHYNAGLTDFWLNLKYQFMEGDWPMAIQATSRFPDFYSTPGDYTGTEIPINSYTDVEGPEWRGLMKRDLGFYYLIGHSFGAAAYAQSQLGYNLRQGAYADQWYFELDGGYNFYNVLGTSKVTVKALFDYTGGVGNGDLPNATDRFDFTVNGAPQANDNFNNSKTGRLYGGLIYAPSATSKWAIEGGIGHWMFGEGSKIYTETYGQFDYFF